MAMDVPVTTMPMAVDWWEAGTMRVAMGVAMDQKTEWAKATPIREARRV